MVAVSATLLLGLLLGTVYRAAALDNGLGLTPWMGWSAWETFRCTTCEQDPDNCLSEKLIKETTDAMVSNGFRDAGYKIVWIDDCWADKEKKGPDGAIAEDAARFPNGMKAVADYVHSQNMSLGLYGDIGTSTCAGFPGLAGNFEANANQMAEWGVDAFKVDGCNSNFSNMKHTYPQLGAALNRSGRPMLFSCSWPDYERSESIPVNFSLVAEYCNTWRAFWDVQAGQYAHTQAARYDCISGAMEFWATGSTMAAAEFSASCPGDARMHPRDVNHTTMVAAAKPGSFNDADMLPIGCTFSMNGQGKKIPVTAFNIIGHARNNM